MTMATVLRILGLGLALLASPAVACTFYPFTTVTEPYCRAQVPTASDCSTRYRLVLTAPRPTGQELALHLPWNISARCYREAVARWGCFVEKCYGQHRGVGCPSISPACWQQID